MIFFFLFLEWNLINLEMFNDVAMNLMSDRNMYYEYLKWNNNNKFLIGKISHICYIIKRMNLHGRCQMKSFDGI